MTHAVVPMVEPTVHSTHPFKHLANHDKLLEYCLQRLKVGKQSRDAQLPRLKRVDRKVAGVIRLRDADIARFERSEETGEPFVTRMNLPLAFVHLDDMMTYLAETFAPSRGMFHNTGNPEEIEEAGQIVTKMNNDALYNGYYSEVLQTLFSTLKYNLGGVVVTWGSDNGPVGSQTGGEVADRSFESAVRWQGNRLKALDNYNTLLDPSVRPERLHLEGEFAAYVELKSRFWVLTRASRGQLGNVKRATSAMGEANRCEFYRHPPAEAKLSSDTSRGSTDWVAILSQRPDAVQDGHEVTTLFIRLNPTEFGLVPNEEKRSRNRYELWKLTILDAKWICAASWQDNVHDHIPFYFGLVHNDSMGHLQRSPAEVLTPLQDFASFLLNTHQESERASIYGTTFYDPTMVKLDEVPKGEVAARVPVEPRAYGRDIRSFLFDMRATRDTQNTMQNLGQVMQIVDQFFPTQALPSQIASIDRAVSNQVAAVQHGANRRQQKTARQLDDSQFRPMRFAMYYNILQYQPDGEELTDFYTGKQIKLDLSKLKDTNLPFIIGQGLKAIDRQSNVEKMQQLIFSMLQAPQLMQPDPVTGERIDLLGLINFWTDMMDMDVDMRQFRITPQAAPTGAAPTDAADGENPINPITNPAAITEPIYG